VQPLWKIVHELLKKLNTELPYDPKVPLMGIYSEESKARFQKDLYTRIHSSIIDNGQNVEGTQVSTKR